MLVCHVRKEEGVDRHPLGCVLGTLHREQLLLALTLFELVVYWGGRREKGREKGRVGESGREREEGREREGRREDMYIMRPPSLSCKCN